MAKLDAADRKALPSGEFAGPGRSFPIPDKVHAQKALQMRKFAPNPSAIVAAVHRKFPGVGAGVDARANGGPVDAGKSYLVGEKGPEMFKPTVSGMISPNSAGMARRTGLPNMSRVPTMRPFSLRDALLSKMKGPKP